MNSASTQKVNKMVVSIEDPPLARFLFGDVRFSWFWLIVRLYTGYEWFTAGWGKLTSSSEAPGWLGAKAGTSLAGFVNGALAKTTGSNPSVQGWYATFLQNVILPHVHFWSYIVVFGEILVGIALILGIFTGIAAFFGGFMNVNYLLAGTVSVNPFLFVFATWLVLAWKTAGWLGLDHWILPLVGVPGHPGKVFAPKASEKPA